MAVTQTFDGRGNVRPGDQRWTEGADAGPTLKADRIDLAEDLAQEQTVEAVEDNLEQAEQLQSAVDAGIDRATDPEPTLEAKRAQLADELAQVDAAIELGADPEDA